MGKTREIKKRMKAVANIRRITKTMQMIATAKFSAAQQRATSSKPYTTALFNLVNELAGGSDEISHPLLDTGSHSGGSELTLVITSDRGLCGPYNASVIRTAMKFLRENDAARGGEVEIVGKKGFGVLKFNRIPIAANHTQFGDKPRYDDVERLAQSYIDRFSAGEIGRVRVISMEFHSVGRQSPGMMQLLPLEPPEAGEGSKTSYEFSPAGPELLDELLPAAIKAKLFQTFNDAVVSEHVARMVAMKAATDNAGKMGKSLTRQYNRARQSQITTELTEIVSGAAALE